MSMGQQIRERRLELRLTLADVAKAVGVTRATILKYENETITKIPSDKVLLLAVALKCSPNTLMGWDKKQEMPINKGECRITDEDLKFALWGDSDEINDDDLEDVRRYAAFVAERKNKNK